MRFLPIIIVSLIAIFYTLFHINYLAKARYISCPGEKIYEQNHLKLQANYLAQGGVNFALEQYESLAPNFSNEPVWLDFGPGKLGYLLHNDLPSNPRRFFNAFGVAKSKTGEQVEITIDVVIEKQRNKKWWIKSWQEKPGIHWEKPKIIPTPFRRRMQIKLPPTSVPTPVSR